LTHFVRGGVGHRYICLPFLGKFGSDVVLFGFQWPVLIGLSRRSLNRAPHRTVIPSGKQDRARRGRRPHLLNAQIIIYTTDCTPLLRNAGRWLAPSYSFAHANHRDTVAVAVKCLAIWKRASTP
jgi:hypothetical protein